MVIGHMRGEKNDIRKVEERERKGKMGKEAKRECRKHLAPCLQSAIC